jgi:hypothetical protein
VAARITGGVGWVLDTRCSHERGARAVPPTHVHSNGSVNLADAESVMREIASRVPSGLRRVPDGETGDRGNWIFFQMQKFLASPSLVPAGPLEAAEGDYEQVPQVRLADGVDPAQMAWPDLVTPAPTSGRMRPSPRYAGRVLSQAASVSRSSTRRRSPRSAPTSSRSSSRRCWVPTSMGRVDREDIPVLLDLHRQIVAES